MKVVARLHDQGLSGTQIAERLGFHGGTVRRALQAMGRGRAERRSIPKVPWGRRLQGLLASVRQRCTNPSDPLFQRYGARGISLCDEWGSFWPFYDWAVASGYRPGLIIALDPGAREFGPSTCRWITAAEKARRDRSRLGPDAHSLTAFGECKALRDWLRDPRCVVREDALRDRLRAGASPEDALSTPRWSPLAVDGRRARRWRKPQRRLDWKQIEKLHVQDGLTPAEIAERVKSHERTIRGGLAQREVLRRRKRVSADEARLRKLWGALRAHCENPDDSEYHYYGAKGRRLCAAWRDFDEFSAWARSSGYRPNLCLSLRPGTWVYSPRNAIWVTRPEASRLARHMPKRIRPRWELEAFGERKGPSEWERDPRCKVTLSGLLIRLRNGWDVEDAISIAPRHKGGSDRAKRIVEAFGVSRSLQSWCRDRRCKVTRSTLIARLRKGVPAEEAITTPPFQLHRKARNGRG